MLPDTCSRWSQMILTVLVISTTWTRAAWTAIWIAAGFWLSLLHIWNSWILKYDFSRFTLIWRWAYHYTVIMSRFLPSVPPSALGTTLMSTRLVETLSAVAGLCLFRRLPSSLVTAISCWNPRYSPLLHAIALTEFRSCIFCAAYSRHIVAFKVFLINLSFSVVVTLLFCRNRLIFSMYFGVGIHLRFFKGRNETLFRGW